jgi:ATP-dependent helicase Lhr and Lhr-like helicase
LVTVDSEQASPFAASLLFSYVASFLYDGDAPLAERRAQALAVDQAQLRELIGDAELRELLDGDSMDDVERQLQRLDEKYRARSVDAVHDMLIGLGDLTGDEIVARSLTIAASEAADALVSSRRAIPVRVAGETRFIAVEDAGRYRDGLGIPLPQGLPEALLEPVRDPIGDLALRYARTHAPFTADDFAARYALGADEAAKVLSRLAGEGHLLEGEFRPGGSGREWTDADVLRMVRRRSLARMRHEIEPVDHAALARFATAWQGIASRRSGADALLDAIEQLQGAPLAASILETDILPARVERYHPGDLDAVLAAGEITWVGVEPLGARDGRVALYLSDHLRALVRPAALDEKPDGREAAIVEALASGGASFFGPLHQATGGGFPRETVDALWNLVWRGLVTNDTFQSLRAFTRTAAPPHRRLRADRAAPFRSRRLAPHSAEGRWSLVPRSPVEGETPKARKAAEIRGNTAWATATAQQLLARHGVLTREAVAAESIPGGFGAVYPVLKAMDDSGRLRRGYFVAGLGATQFALPGALDRLRSLRAPESGDTPEIAVLAAADPANPYGAALAWPPAAARVDTPGRGPTRTVGATVILVDGRLAGYLARGDRVLLTWLPDAEPDRSKAGRAIAQTLITRARAGGETPRGMLVEEIDGQPPDAHPMAPFLAAAGFIPGAMGFQATLTRRHA